MSASTTNKPNEITFEANGAKYEIGLIASPSVFSIVNKPFSSRTTQMYEDIISSIKIDGEKYRLQSLGSVDYLVVAGGVTAFLAACLTPNFGKDSGART